MIMMLLVSMVDKQRKGDYDGTHFYGLQNLLFWKNTSLAIFLWLYCTGSLHLPNRKINGLKALTVYCIFIYDPSADEMVLLFISCDC